MPFREGLLEVRQSSVGGLGLFAKVDIPGSTVIWRYDASKERDAWENLGEGPNRDYDEEEIREMEERSGTPRR
jgi:hypothetical protein